KLLSMMADPDLQILQPALEIVELAARVTIVDAGETIEYLYLPHSAVICLMTVMRERGLAEAATVGPEGVVGFEVLLGRTMAMHRALVQIPGRASRIAVPELSRAVRDSDTLRDLLLPY